MIELIDGKLHQWDTGRKVKVSLESKTVSEVHFSTIALENALVVLPYEENGIIVAEIPNILLQNKWDICVHVVSTTEDCERTIGKRTFGVCHRPKPEDYVYTETEVLTWESLDERIKKLEKGTGGADISKEDIQDAVNEYLDNNPVSVNETDPTVPDWAKQPNPPKQPDALPNPNKLTFSGAVSAEYDGSKAVEVVIPQGGGWELIDNLTVAEPVKSITWENLNYREIKIYAYNPRGTGGAAYVTPYINGNTVIGDAGHYAWSGQFFAQGDARGVIEIFAYDDCASIALNGNRKMTAEKVGSYKKITSVQWGSFGEVDKDQAIRAGGRYIVFGRN